MNVALTITAGLVGVIVGAAINAALSRRNERRAHADRLLAETLNDLVGSVADVAGGDAAARRRYASTPARIALYGSPELVAAVRSFQDASTTGTPEGRRRLVAAVQSARRELGRAAVDDEAVHVLLFGPATPHE